MAETADKLTYASDDQPALMRTVIRLVERLSGKRHLIAMYERAVACGPLGFFGGALRELEVTLDADEAQLAKIPRGGPLVFIANHPFGVVDGLILCDIAARTRGEFKVLLHQALFREPTLEHLMLPIDFSGTREAARRNIEARNEAIELLKRGGTVLIFPAGGISTSRGWRGPVTDLEWSTLPARMIQASKATVVPVYFEGRNSRLFQLVSQFSVTLRLSMVIREVHRLRRTRVRVAVGDPIPFEELAEIKNRNALMQLLRTRTFALGGEAALEAAAIPARLSA
ncbi:MAG: lysophospholipid acyltransferase family protein [Alphaproteobacteria bacterium]|nr:lysophospholipid acyltransferase family protein [Alphaproteobacteria bacterium]